MVMNDVHVESISGSSSGHDEGSENGEDSEESESSEEVEEVLSDKTVVSGQTWKDLKNFAMQSNFYK